MSFTEKVKEKLSKYKTAKFPMLQDGKWKKNKRAYPYILPKKNTLDNLLPTYKDAFVACLDKHEIKLHSDFHHLNSSQAMCFNFFFPLFYERKLELVADFLGLKNETVNYDSACFEKTGLETKYGRRPTCFDFYFETISGKKLYFEIKYTEGEFGKAKINTDKFDSVYSKHLTALNSQFHTAQMFFDNYQILRNLIHIDDSAYVTFVYPLENDGINIGVNKVKTEFLIPRFHNNFLIITWDNIFKNIKTKNLNDRLSNQFNEFQEKYL